MFTGLIQETGILKKISKEENLARLTITLPESVRDGFNVGDSMAVNGVCLTATRVDLETFTSEVINETYIRTNLKFQKIGSPLNLERALSIQGRLEGHIVTGHVDCVSRILEVRTGNNSKTLKISLPKELYGEIVGQGSIAVNGVSLTVVKASRNSFTVSIIDHSNTNTNIRNMKAGDLVNLESDVIGKYVKNLIRT